MQVSQAVIASARRVMLVADSSKFLRSAPVWIAYLSDVDVLVTDRMPSAEVAALCAGNNVQVLDAGGPTEADELPDESSF